MKKLFSLLVLTTLVGIATAQPPKQIRTGGLDTTSLSNRIDQKLNKSDTANHWLSHAVAINDSTLRFQKGNTTFDVVIKGRLPVYPPVIDTSNHWVSNAVSINDSTIRFTRGNSTFDVIVKGGISAGASPTPSWQQTVDVSDTVRNVMLTIHNEATDIIWQIGGNEDYNFNFFGAKGGIGHIQFNTNLALQYLRDGEDTITVDPVGGKDLNLRFPNADSSGSVLAVSVDGKKAASNGDITTLSFLRNDSLFQVQNGVEVYRGKIVRNDIVVDPRDLAIPGDTLQFAAKEYVVEILQEGTDAPFVVYEMKNTLGETPVFEYSSTGSFALVTTGGIFTEGKTVVEFPQGGFDVKDGSQIVGKGVSTTRIELYSVLSDILTNGIIGNISMGGNSIPTIMRVIVLPN